MLRAYISGIDIPLNNLKPTKMIIIAEIDIINSLNEFQLSINNNKNPNIIIKPDQQHITILLNLPIPLPITGLQHNQLFLNHVSPPPPTQNIPQLYSILRNNKGLKPSRRMYTNLQHSLLIIKLIILT